MLLFYIICDICYGKCFRIRKLWIIRLLKNLGLNTHWNKVLEKAEDNPLSYKTHHEENHKHESTCIQLRRHHRIYLAKSNRHNIHKRCHKREEYSNECIPRLMQQKRAYYHSNHKQKGTPCQNLAFEELIYIHI